MPTLPGGLRRQASHTSRAEGFSLRVTRRALFWTLVLEQQRKQTETLPPQSPYSVVSVNSYKASDVSFVFPAPLEVGWNQNGFDRDQTMTDFAQREFSRLSAKRKSEDPGTEPMVCMSVCDVCVCVCLCVCAPIHVSSLKWVLKVFTQRKWRQACRPQDASQAWIK